MIKDDFVRHAGIFAITPDLTGRRGCGWAVFSEDTGRLKQCGLIKVFAPGGPIINNMDETLEKLTTVWEKGAGFSYRPKRLCVGYPLVHKFNKKTLGALLYEAEFFGTLKEHFKAEESLRVCSTKWKSSESVAALFNSMDSWSKKAMGRDLSLIGRELHNNVLDAIRIGKFSLGTPLRKQVKRTQGQLQRVCS